MVIHRTVVAAGVVATLVALAACSLDGAFVDTVGPSPAFSTAAEEARDRLVMVLPNARVTVIDATQDFKGTYQEGAVEGVVDLGGDGGEPAQACADVRRRFAAAGWATDLCTVAYSSRPTFTAQAEDGPSAWVAVSEDIDDGDLTVVATIAIDQRGLPVGGSPCLPGDDLVCLGGAPVEDPSGWEPVPFQRPLETIEHAPDSDAATRRDLEVDLQAALAEVTAAVPGVRTSVTMNEWDGWRLHAWHHEFRPGTDVSSACVEQRSALVARRWDTEVCEEFFGSGEVSVWRALPAGSAVGTVALSPGRGLDTADGREDAVALTLLLYRHADALASVGSSDFCVRGPEECLTSLAIEDASAWPDPTPELEEAIERLRCRSSGDPHGADPSCVPSGG